MRCSAWGFLHEYLKSLLPLIQEGSRAISPILMWELGYADLIYGRQYAQQRFPDKVWFFQYQPRHKTQIQKEQFV